MAKSLLPIDELNILCSYIENLRVSGELRSKRKEIIDKFEEFLIYSLFLGSQYANDNLESSVSLDDDIVSEIIYSPVAGKTWVDRLDEYIDNEERSAITHSDALKKLPETEMHRVYCGGEFETARKAEAKYKIYKTMNDERVRETHDYLEGVRIPLDSEFITYDGDHAQMPGGFTKAENNVNCRCWLDFE